MADFRRSNEDDVPEPTWVTAKRALAAAGRSIGGPDTRVEVGFVKHIGSGLSRDAYAATVEIGPTKNCREQTLVAVVPGRGTDLDVDARIVQEARVLTGLARLLDEAPARTPPFRVPGNAVAVRSDGRLALVSDFARGFPLDLRAGRRHERPWEIVGQIAAGVHAIAPARIDAGIEGFSTRREHALSALRAMDGLDEDVFDAARAWAAENLPPDDPAVMLHGDLRGPNILLLPGEPPSVIDWEYATLGDPAYDLAILTRGVRQPFQTGSGLAKLLDAHRAAGGVAITAAHVRFHELCLAAKWYADALHATGPDATEEAMDHGARARQARARNGALTVVTEPVLP